MNRILTTIAGAILLCFTFSCSQPPRNTEAKRRADSLAIAHKADSLAKLMLQQKQDSLAKAQAAARRKHHYGPCPVSVKTCALVGSGAGKAIVVTIKNISAKRIAAVKLAWTVFNRKNQRLGSSAGMAKKLLAKGSVGSYSWGVNAESGTRAIASVASIHYADGSVWMAD
jgi:hypothetical protein